MPDIKPRVRFAPSPTGDLHVGGLRTALYNFLFARKHEGSFILRIEDTDRERHLPNAAANILQILHRCGLNPDEGPEIGGNFGPYVQSERLDIYKQFAQKLLQDGHAYPCFCGVRSETERGETQRVAGQGAGYDRRCRSIDLGLALERMHRETHVLRLKVPLDGQVIHHDRIWGEVAFPFADVDDQVIVKSDGYPTYHLANVVDDHLMQITHVIRGEEWLPSVPKHLLLYSFLGVQPPEFAHLPLILNEHRQKLSKREGTGSVMAWLERGILPEALINYVALLGWHSSDNKDVYSLSELIQAFDLDRVNKSGGVFDPVKLEWLSGEHIRRLEIQELMDRTGDFLKGSEFATLDPDQLQVLIGSIRNNLHRFDQLANLLNPFSINKPEPNEEARVWLDSEAARRTLPLIIERWRDLSSADPETLLNQVRDVGKETTLKGKDLWMPIRVAISGLTTGPELRAIIAHLGTKETMQRLAYACTSFP
jgi:nondiscriminating glutamyl-tRNA synthetase